MSAGVQYIECDVLASLLLSNRAQVAVVDVRDEDYVEGGHIRGAVNVPSSSFNEAEMDRLISSALDGKEKVVVHCMFSQQRGPRSAVKLAQRLQEVHRRDISVLVLRGGYRRFCAIYGSDPALCEDVDSC
jgi:rhodanese-related sulfurtransferase